MTGHQYVAWFRDRAMSSDEQVYEWCACFVIEAADGGAALAWGDHLAEDYGGRSGCEFLRSYLDPDVWEDASVPRVVAGIPEPDEVIGW